MSFVKVLSATQKPSLLSFQSQYFCLILIFLKFEVQYNVVEITRSLMSKQKTYYRQKKTFMTLNLTFRDFFLDLEYLETLVIIYSFMFIFSHGNYSA